MQRSEPGHAHAELDATSPGPRSSIRAPIAGATWFGTAVAAFVMTLAGAAGAAQSEPRVEPPRPELDALAKTLLAQGIFVDFDASLCAIAAHVEVRDDFLEYVLVNRHGAAHESLFVTDVVPSRLNVALLALGLVPGKNAVRVKKTANPQGGAPPAPADQARGDGAEGGPAPQDRAAEARQWEVVPPSGDAMFLYAAWRADGETYLFRVEDLIRNLAAGKSMRRHGWTYLGSRMARPRSAPEREVFAADLEGNLINVALFEQGNTLFTASLPECIYQTIWLPNAWLLPEPGTEVTLVFARRPITAVPPALEARLPVAPSAAKEHEPR